MKPLCFSMPCLGGAKHLAVSAIQSDKVCVCMFVLKLVCVHRKSARYESERENEAKERMTG